MFDLLTDSRREFVAKAIMDVVKFVFGAGAVSGFFATAPFGVRAVIGAAILVFFLIAWALHPSKGGY